MSIETEFESTITNVKNAYQGLDNLGATIPQNKTIENIKNCLDEIYNKFPKTAYAEGSNITLSNTLKGKLDFEEDEDGKKKIGYGQTEQNTTKGINMLDLSNFSAETTINGVKFTPVENGGIKINGTATANAILEFAFSLVLNGNYTMATKLDGTFTNNESPQVILRSSNATVIYNSGMQQNAIKINTFNNINSTIDKVRIVAVNGSTYNCIIYPMCLSGIYNADNLPNFEKFTGNSPSPSPSYPQDIEVVRGKNRLNLENCTKLGNATRTNETSNSVELTGVGAWSNGAYIFPNFAMNTNLRISLKLKSSVARTTGITIFGTNTNDTSGLTSINEDTSSLTANIEKEYSVIFNSGNYKYICMRIWTNYSTTTLDRAILEATEIMLSKGSQATSYLPYNTIEVVERGINLLDKTQVVGNNTATIVTQINTGFRVSAETLGYAGVTTIDVKANTNYFLKFNTNVIVDSGSQKYVRIFAGTTQTTTIATYTFTEGGGTFNTGNNTKINIWFYCSLGGSGTVDYTNVQLEEGSTATTYEPYQTPQTYQLSLGEYEFAKIGNYRDYIWTDRETGKWYIHKELIKLQLTSSLNWSGLFVSQINLYRVDTNDFANIIKYQSSSSQFGLCNRYINSWNDTMVYLSAGHFAVFTDGKIYITTQFTTNNMAVWKDFLDNNDVYVVVPLATPTDTEITDTTFIEQAEEIYNIMSLNGTTIIEIDGNLPMIIKVRALKGE